MASRSSLTPLPKGLYHSRAALIVSATCPDRVLTTSPTFSFSK